MSELAVADTEMSRREDGGALVETPAGSMPAASDDEETDLEGGSAHNYDRIPFRHLHHFPLRARRYCEQQRRVFRRPGSRF